MNLRLPESGSLVESLLNTLGHTVANSTAGQTVPGVTEPQLTMALDALVRSDVEFVVLENGDDFLQAAGASPFALQHSDAQTSTMSAAAGGVDERILRAAFSAYLRGDVSWRSLCRWDRI
jgi:hypothetical protein